MPNKMSHEIRHKESIIPICNLLSLGEITLTSIDSLKLLNFPLLTWPIPQPFYLHQNWNNLCLFNWPGVR